VRPSSLRIEPDRARELLEGGAVLVDVRRQDDHTAALPGALRITPDGIPGQLATLREAVAIVLACT
jgi:rhodanese-related sulfurtransferase